MSKILGHKNLSTTTRYLNIQRRGLHLAMEKLEESQRMAAEDRKKRTEGKSEAVAQPLHTAEKSAQAFVPDSQNTQTPKPLIS